MASRRVTSESTPWDSYRHYLEPRVVDPRVIISALPTSNPSSILTAFKYPLPRLRIPLHVCRVQIIFLLYLMSFTSFPGNFRPPSRVCNDPAAFLCTSNGRPLGVAPLNTSDHVAAADAPYPLNFLSFCFHNWNFDLNFRLSSSP